MYYSCVKNPSHRARVPNVLRAVLGPDQWSPTSSALNVEKAVFERTWTSPAYPQLEVLERVFAHRSRRGLLVSSFTFPSFMAPYNVSWKSSPGPQSQDISFSDTPLNSVTCGATLVTEAQGSLPTRVCFSSKYASGSVTVTNALVITRLLYITYVYSGCVCTFASLNQLH
jgi:hypothetical protein